jgi:hypothetical protein
MKRLRWITAVGVLTGSMWMGAPANAVECESYGDELPSICCEDAASAVNSASRKLLGGDLLYCLQ